MGMGKKTGREGMKKEMDSNEEEDKENLSEAEYSKKSEFSKALLVEKALEVVKEKRSQEMKEGYYNFIPMPNGDVKKIYIPDSRKEFIGAVDYLKSILSPEIKVNEDMKTLIEDIEKKKTRCFNKNAVERRFDDGDEVKIATEKYIPDMDDPSPLQRTTISNLKRTQTKEVCPRIGFYNYNVRKYWNEMVIIYDELLSQLNILLSSKKINYFKQKTGY